ncbi:MAG: hypothetical protein OEZ36_07610 [Spirochaetota bacterium]|nr:hypothetical protein [Spirochaetota bacterium]
MIKTKPVHLLPEMHFEAKKKCVETGITLKCYLSDLVRKDIESHYEAKAIEGK